MKSVLLVYETTERCSLISCLIFQLMVRVMASFAIQTPSAKNPLPVISESVRVIKVGKEMELTVLVSSSIRVAVGILQARKMSISDLYTNKMVTSASNAMHIACIETQSLES